MSGPTGLEESSIGSWHFPPLQSRKNLIAILRCWVANGHVWKGVLSERCLTRTGLYVALGRVWMQGRVARSLLAAEWYSSLCRSLGRLLEVSN